MNTDEIFKIICGIIIVVNGIYFLKCRKKLFSFLLSGILGFAALVLLNKYGLFKEEAGESSEKSSESGGIFDNFDFSMLTKLQDIMGAVSQKDKNTDLLLALKPHLKEERQQKIDKAIKIMKLLAVWKVLKDSGMLKDFL